MAVPVNRKGNRNQARVGATSGCPDGRTTSASTALSAATESSLPSDRKCGAGAGHVLLGWGKFSWGGASCG